MFARDDINCGIPAHSLHFFDSKTALPTQAAFNPARHSAKAPIQVFTADRYSCD